LKISKKKECKSQKTKKQKTKERPNNNEQVTSTYVQEQEANVHSTEYKNKKLTSY